MEVLTVLGPSWHHLGPSWGPWSIFGLFFSKTGVIWESFWGSLLEPFSCFFASFLVLFFHYPAEPNLPWIFIDFGSHFGIIFVTFSSILAMCWERLLLQSQPLPALSGGIRFHTFSHLFSHSHPDPCFSHFFFDVGLHFGLHFGTFSLQKAFRKPG